MPATHPDSLHPAAHPATLCVHAGGTQAGAAKSVVTPIFQSATFVLDEERLDELGRNGITRETLLYSRSGNPSQWALQERLAALEGAESAIVFSSGMAAISSVVLSLAERGQEVVASRELYGGTLALFDNELPEFGLRLRLVDPHDPDAVRAAIGPATGLLYFETVSNPMTRVTDLARIAAISQESGVPLAVDATFSTPLGCRPLELGATVSLHSASKYLNGHSDLVAGCAAGSKQVLQGVWSRMQRLGGQLDPHACFLLERGLKTLAVRMRAHQEAAVAVAAWLEAQPRVRCARHPRLPSHPDHALAERLLRNAGGMVAFVVEGGEAAARAVATRLRLIRCAPSLGGVETLVSLPSLTSHARLNAAQREAAGIPPGTIRLSVGIEDPADLIADLEQALRA